MSILGWGFRADKQIYQSKTPLKLTLKSGETVEFQQLVENLPSANTKEKLRLHPLLFNGVLQSMYYYKGDFSDKFKIYYGREIFTFKDQGICSLDWVIEPETDDDFKSKYENNHPKDWPRLFPRTRFLSDEELSLRKQDSESTKPIVLILHGLAGGSHESLIRNLAELLTTGKNHGKFDVVVNLTRGCGRTKLTTGKLFNALAIEDVHEVLLDLKQRYPKRPIYASGFSFGAALLTNYLGTYGDEKLIKAATLVGCPFNLGKASDVMKTLWSGKLMNPALVGFLCKVVKNNMKELNAESPELFNKENLAKAQKFKVFEDFDNMFTCKTAGFDSAKEYYAKGSPENRLGSIKTPLLSISSSDDPATGKYLPIDKFESNEHISALETNLGGHLAFVTPEREFWCVRVIDEFFEAFEDIE